MLTVNVMLGFVILMDKVGFSNLGIFDTESNAFLSHDRLLLLIQWIMYATFVCAFHLLEFFVTAFYNPSVVNASSFVVNHSRSYTVAMLVSINVSCPLFFRSNSFCSYYNDLT